MPSSFFNEFWYLSLREVMSASVMSRLGIKAKRMPMSSALLTETVTEQWQNLLYTNSDDSF